MVADSIEVTSRSYQAGSLAAVWRCAGEDTFTIQPADQPARGTTITLHLKNDAAEFCQESRLRVVIQRHSEFISFPIYLGDKLEQINRQTALWRQPPRKTEKKDYQDFHRQITLDPAPPLTYAHLAIDAPVQMFAIMFVPESSTRGVFSLRKEDGLKLYSRKILIQEYCKDLLPQYFRFIQGVVDSEDLPLNVARESYQSSRVITQLKSLLTSKVIDMLEKLATDEPAIYIKFWQEFGTYIKEGIATEASQTEMLYPLLRFHTSTQQDGWTSLDDYCSRMESSQKDIYYLLGDDAQSITHSPHLDYLRRRNYEVLLLTDPIDPFLLIRLTQYNDHPLINIASADFKVPDSNTSTDESAVTSSSGAGSPDEWLPTLQLFQSRLGDKVASVRMTDRLSDSPARLVDPEGSIASGLHRVYRFLNENYEIPKKILELNPSHPIIKNLTSLPPEDPLGDAVIDQIFENALLIEGLHPNPASMIDRIDKIMQAALKK
jgi:molecular chaperone HtpG